MNDEAVEPGAEASRQHTATDAQSGSEGSEAGVAEFSNEVERLTAELNESREQALRLAAEMDNVRKRSAREVENAHRFGIERFAEALLPVFDSLEAGVSADNVDLDTLLEGQKATLRLLEQAFADAGIEQHDPHGEPFDPKVHEAISILPAPHAEPDSVIDVVQKGYSLRERLLRPARVVVAQSADK